MPEFCYCTCPCLLISALCQFEYVDEEPTTPKSVDGTEKADPSSEKTVPSSEGVRSSSPAPSRISKRQRMQSPAPTTRRTRSTSRSPAPERPPPERKTPRRTSKAALTVSPVVETSPGKSIEVTQSISTDPVTGVPTETTKVRLDLGSSPTKEGDSTGPALVASEQEVTASLEQGKELVERLKQEGVLREAAGPSKRQRADDEDEEDKRPFWRRPWIARRKPREASAVASGESVASPVTPKGRRLAALAGVVVVGAAT
jgi:hypothetical protein